MENIPVPQDEMEEAETSAIQAEAQRALPVPSSAPSEELALYERKAKDVCRSPLVPRYLQGNAVGVLSIALAGRELGLGFMESMRHIYLVDGVTTLKTELKLAMAKRAGLKLKILDRTPMMIRLQGTYSDSSWEVEWAMTAKDRKNQDASLVPERLVTKTNWKEYPTQMLFWRAVNQLIRELMPEAPGASFYGSEEIQ